MNKWVLSSKHNFVSFSINQHIFLLSNSFHFSLYSCTPLGANTFFDTDSSFKYYHLFALSSRICFLVFAFISTYPNLYLLQPYLLSRLFLFFTFSLLFYPSIRTLNYIRTISVFRFIFQHCLLVNPLIPSHCFIYSHKLSSTIHNCLSSF